MTGEVVHPSGDRIQALVESACQDCVSLERTFDPMSGWVWIFSTCLLDEPLEAWDFAEIEGQWAAHSGGPDAHNEAAT